MKMDDLCFLCYGTFVYGFGNSPKEAIEAASRSAAQPLKKKGILVNYQLLLVHKDTSIDNMGCVSFPRNFPPRTVEIQGKYKFLEFPELTTLKKK